MEDETNKLYDNTNKYSRFRNEYELLNTPIDEMKQSQQGTRNSESSLSQRR